MARELFDTAWIKLEVVGDDYTLQPDPFELVDAARTLVSDGFEVFPYCTDDLVTCQRLLDAGCRILMPVGRADRLGPGAAEPDRAAHLARAPARRPAGRRRRHRLAAAMPCMRWSWASTRCW